MSHGLSSFERRAGAISRIISRVALGSFVAVPVLVALGCAGDAAVAPPPATNVDSLYWALTLDHRAVTLSPVAPYDTIRLTATPRNAHGEPLSGLPAPTFTSLDLDRAQVSADGLVHVIGAGTGVPVVATLVVGNVRHADTAMINVTSTATPPVLASLSIHPDAHDTAAAAAQSNQGLPAQARGADSAQINGLSIYYESLDRTVATIDRSTGFFQPTRPGHVTVIATATAYGVTKADTLPVTVGYPVNIVINVKPQKDVSGHTVNGFAPSDITVGVGAVLLFFNNTGVATDITFDDPTNVAQDDRDCAYVPWFCGTGSIAAWAKDSSDPTGLSASRARRFPVPGTYTYHSTIFGTTGRIVVVDPRTLP
jgi:plastocyanin